MAQRKGGGVSAEGRVKAAAVFKKGVVSVSNPTYDTLISPLSGSPPNSASHLHINFLTLTMPGAVVGLPHPSVRYLEAVALTSPFVPQNDMVKFRDANGTVREGIILEEYQIQRTLSVSRSLCLAATHLIVRGGQDGRPGRSERMFLITEFNTEQQYRVPPGYVTEVTGHL